MMDFHTEQQPTENTWEWQVIMAIHQQIGERLPLIRDAFESALRDYRRGAPSGPAWALHVMLQRVRKQQVIYVLGSMGFIRVQPWTGEIADEANQVGLTCVDLPPVPPEIKDSFWKNE